MIRRLVRVVAAGSAGSAVNREIPRALTLTISSVTAACKELVSVRRVGRVLGKMRWRAERTARAKGWTIVVAELQR